MATPRRKATKKRATKKRTTATRSTAKRAAAKKSSKKATRRKTSAKKTASRKPAAKKSAASKTAAKRSPSPAIEGATPLRRQREVGAKTLTLPRSVDRPTKTRVLREGRLDSFSHHEHATLKLPVTVSTKDPVRPTAIRSRSLARRTIKS